MTSTTRRLGVVALSIMLFLPPGEVGAGPLRDLIMERRAERQQTRASSLREADDDGVSDVAPQSSLPSGIRAVRDIAWGRDPKQRFDVYFGERTSDVAAPVIFMVHGGGWRYGSKSAASVVENKVARWVPRGFVLISTDYRLLPQADPIEQARDVARALAAAQARAAEWGGDARRFILMGHSAGAHLVALLSSNPALAAAASPQPWLGTVALDSAAYNVVDIMAHRHLPLYDQAFGSDRTLWQAASPWYASIRGSQPLLAVCSSRREDSCRQAHAYAEKAGRLGATVDVLEKDMSHRDINRRLGEEPHYTAEVEAFLGRLDAAMAARLGVQSPR